MLTKKQIEKEPDGYIRDLLNRRRHLTGGVSVIIFHLGFVSMAILTCLLFSATIPHVPQKYDTETYVFNRYEEKTLINARYTRITKTFFIASDGSEFAAPIGFRDEIKELEIGKTYEIRHFKGFLAPEIYTISTDGETIISENDYAEMCNIKRKETYEVFPFIFAFFIAIDLILFVTLYFAVFRKHNVREKVADIDKKIAKRREKLKYNNKE